jgi:pectate lyase
MNVLTSSKFALVSALFALGCSDDGAATDEGGGGTAGTTATGGSAGTAGSGPTGGTAGSAGTGMVVPTPEGTLFMDDFEAGATNWDVTQGTCSIAADEGTNVYTCLQGMEEARAVAGEIWGEYTVSARVRVNAMDAAGGRRIYLAARFTDSNNWYGAAIYDGSPFEVQIRKKVMGTSSDIVRTPYPIELGTWYTMKLEVKGPSLRLSVNDVIQLEAMDTTFSSGRIALLVDRSDVSWDDVLVTNP